MQTVREDLYEKVLDSLPCEVCILKGTDLKPCEISPAIDTNYVSIPG